MTCDDDDDVLLLGQRRLMRHVATHPSAPRHEVGALDNGRLKRKEKKKKRYAVRIKR